MDGDSVEQEIQDSAAASSAIVTEPDTTSEEQMEDEQGEVPEQVGASNEHVEVLEKRIEQQEEEINSLKTSLNEMQGRLKEVEAAVVQLNSKKSNVVQNHLHSTPKPAASHSTKSRSSTFSAARSRPASNKEDTRESISKKSSLDQSSRGGKKAKPKTRKQSGRQTSYNDEDGSVRMHLRGRPVVMYKPSELEQYDIAQPSQKPDAQLELEWVYGYRGKDCRSNLYSLPNGEVAYFIAAVVVLQNPSTSTQRHYKGHNDDVKCMAVHPDKSKIASGQVAGVDLDGKARHPQVHIWDVESLATLHVLQSFDRSVAAVGFSVVNEGMLLCAIDESNDHVMTIWNWQKEKKIAEAKSSKDPVFGCEFNTQVDGSLVTYGKGHINFWTLEGSQLARKQGLFEKHDKPKFILCVAFTSGGEVISGDSNGNIEIWNKGSTKKINRIAENAHEGPVFSIFANQEFFVSGGKDGKIKKWNWKLSTIEQTEIFEDAGAVRVVSCNDEGKLLVGTRTNRILTGSFDGEFQTLVHGHVEELWGLAVHPNNPHFLTGAYDKLLILWDSTSHVPIWAMAMEENIQSAEFHPIHDNVIAVAMTTGRWVVISNREVICSKTDGPEQHDVIRYSPDGARLAIGSHDNNIYVYDVTEDGQTYSKVGQCSGHSSYITHFDWSTDGQFIQSNSGDYELLYWEAASCKQITSTPSMRDVEWATQSCVLGFSVLGIWPEGADGTDINCVGRSKNDHLLASGDDFGKVHLFNYPCAQPKSVSRDYGGHSSHVTSLGFLGNDEKLMTTGGQDCSIMQWHIV